MRGAFGWRIEGEAKSYWRGMKVYGYLFTYDGEG